MDLNTIDVSNFLNSIRYDSQPLSFVFLALQETPRETVERDYLIE